MNKRIVFLSVLIASFFISGEMYTHASPAQKAAAPKVSKDKAETSVSKEKVEADASKQPKKNDAPAEDKYPIIYLKCTKVAEADEEKYEQLFDSCMAKNGFPQDSLGGGGYPVDGGDVPGD